MPSNSWGLGALVFAGVCVACSGGSDGSSVGASQTGASSAVSYSDVYTEVLSTCTDHHSGANAAGNLDLSSASVAFTNLVGVAAQGPACGASALGGAKPLLRVDPGNADESLLYQKLAGTQTCGASMPDLEPALPASQVDLVKTWINAGAAKD